MKQWLDSVTEAMPELVIRTEEPMSKHTTFRIGGAAEVFAAPDARELPQLLAMAKGADVPVTVIGNGSNLLVGDRGIAGLVIEIGERMSEVRIEGTILVAGAGALLSKAAQTAAAAGLGDLEFAAGIPGSVGGAVVMNAGAYGGEMKDVLQSVKVLTEEGELLSLAAAELELGYRHSCVPERKYIVVEATMELSAKPEEEIRACMAELRAKRVEKQPLEYPSAGSTFKRPEGYYAAALIDQCGLKGLTVGGAQVSEKHAGFVINRGSAACADVTALMAEIQRRVKAQTGVELEPEVRVIK